MLRCMIAVVIFCLAIAGNAYPEEGKPADPSALLNKVVEQTMSGAKILRIEPAEDSPVSHWKQI
ncbi:MAG: hypothetical protein H6Q92_813, partial [Nitrospirae bacterium]|nr:hypothetical protein [Nitrospirota bacterium]